MRVEFLFFRWLLLIAAVALGLVYTSSSTQSRPVSTYETIPLIQGGRSSGMPLAGIVVNPNRRDVYAIVGGPAGTEAPPQFCIVWKGNGGETYGTTFPAGSTGAEALFEVSPDGQVRALHKLSPGGSEQTASAETTLCSIIDALPTESSLR